MTEATATATPPAATDPAQAGTTPPATGAATPPASTPPTAKPKDDSWIDELPEERREYIKGLRSEAGYRRKTATEAEAKLTELQAKVDAAEKEKLAEQGKFKELYEGEQKKMQALNQRLIRQEVKVHAQKEGLIDLDVAELINIEKVTMNDAGQILGAEEAVTQFKLSKPNLFQLPQAAPATPPPAKSTGSPSTPPVTTTTSSQKNVGDLSPEEYKKAKGDWIKS